MGGLSGMGGLVGGHGPFLLDHFTDSNSTALGSHTMDIGPGWSVSNGTWQITSNKAVKTDRDGNYDFAFADATAANITLTVDIVFGSSTRAGAVVRYTDTSNYWMVLAIQLTQGMALYEVNAGSLVLRASSSATLGAATAYTLTITARVQTISVTLSDGSMSYGSASFQQSAKKHAMMSWSSGPTFDNFQVVIA